MASAELREELNCSICLSLYTEPVSLSCGHNFCSSCIVSVLDAQEAAGVYPCPECRTEYPERPALEKNRKLRNIVERFVSAQPNMAEPRITCAYCDSPTAAVRTCVQCDNSLCAKHLAAHNKTMDHILLEPTRSLGNRKCTLHKKVLEYFCPQDAACLCVSCCLVGEHRGHLVELLDEASEKKKEKLREYLDDLIPKKAKIQERVENLQSDKRSVHKKASDKKKNISKIFKDIKKQLETAEAKALSEVSRQEKKIVSQISHLIKKLEIKEDEMCRKMHYVEEMCRVTDPIRLLQESDTTTSSHVDDEESDTGDDEGEVSFEEDLDEVLISLTLHRSLKDIVTDVTSQLEIQVPDILLDVDTASKFIQLSDDLKVAFSSEEQNRLESPGRFLDYTQVLSRCGLISGRHYWKVEWNQIGEMEVGMTYPSIEREGEESNTRLHDKSWCLCMSNETYEVCHNSETLTLSVKSTFPIIGVFLDYEAGCLSFYDLRDQIRHLHTFTASFTEPLHVAFYVDDGASATITS
ncbi:E3 ubiquitin/ISG15 ligase TRIM25-like [Anomaloglossus baeobatrachus]|uniref:E3 ubiquitin/ISG15 ligase TRIM25-like n=1 Tax=Anomaloglossus baeobatrachus TaxID=238106 RepID=UPI003F500495